MTIIGYVQDPNDGGALVPGAIVTATNSQTNVTEATTTADSDGRYEITVDDAVSGFTVLTATNGRYEVTAVIQDAVPGP